MSASSLLLRAVVLLGAAWLPLEPAVPGPPSAPALWQQAGAARAGQQRQGAPPRAGQQPRPPQQARPAAGDDPILEAIKQLAREHVPDGMVDKAKQVAKSLPEEQKKRLLAQARSTWARVRPMLGDDPARLTATMRRCLALIPEERINAALRVVDDALSKGGPAAAAAVAELVAEGKRDLLPLFMQLLQNQGPSISAGARDPEEEARAWRGMLAAVTTADLLGRESRGVARESMRALADDVPIVIEGRPVTLNAWARRTLAERFPYLADGPVGQDEMATLAAVLVASDIDDLMSELALVHPPFGEPTTVARALAEADPMDEEGVLDALDALEKTVRLRQALKTGVDVAVSADDFRKLAAGAQ